jgi:syntaxin 1B/2/3
VNKVARNIKTELEDLDRANLSSRKSPGCEAGTPTDRTHISITNTLTKKLKDLMGEFQELRQRIMGDSRHDRTQVGSYS